MANKFVDENISTVVNEATVRGYDILDCVVDIECGVTNNIEVRLIDDYFGSREEEKRQYRSTIMQHEGSLGFFFKFSFGSSSVHTVIYRRAWTDIQAAIREDLSRKFDMESLKSQELREELLVELQNTYKL